MIGRAIYGNPWLFRDIHHYFETNGLLSPPSIKERATVCKQHLQACMNLYGERYGLLTLRRHYKRYFKGLPNFKPYYTRLVTLDDRAEIENILSEIRKF